MKAQKMILDYVMNAIEFIDHKDDLITDHAAIIAELMKRFNSEYWYYDNQIRYYNNIVKAMASWLQGLPSDINIAFEYWEVDQLLTTWGYINERSSESKIQKERENYWLYVAGVIIACTYE